ncbi:MAG: polyprenyl synthetase family protein, partial [Candidatus Moranbacteria bacterium CG08_land_8_20_14_0_20_34_16]
MEATEMLAEYKKKLEPFLINYFKRKIKEANRTDKITLQTIKTISDFTLASGKRIRPALVYYGFLAMGGKDGKEIVEVSAGMELIHTFLLIHDDIIDKDEKRHNVPTVHEVYKKIGEENGFFKDNEHFGNSMAIIVGDMAAA